MWSEQGKSWLASNNHFLSKLIKSVLWIRCTLLICLLTATNSSNIASSQLCRGPSAWVYSQRSVLFRRIYSLAGGILIWEACKVSSLCRLPSAMGAEVGRMKSPPRTAAWAISMLTFKIIQIQKHRRSRHAEFAFLFPNLIQMIQNEILFVELSFFVDMGE